MSYLFVEGEQRHAVPSLLDHTGKCSHVCTHVPYSSNMAAVSECLPHMRIVMKFGNDKCLISTDYRIVQETR